jgi:RNA polymerase sigma-70 factor (ECF subfamily)
LANDGTLVQQACGGSRTACDELVRRWSARVLAFCHARAGARQMAEDLAQESLLRAMRSLHTLKAPDKFGSWLFGIATRVCHDWRRNKQASQVPFTCLASDDNPDALVSTDAGATEDEVDRQDEVRRLMDEVHLLPDKYREVLMLYYYQDMTYQDLAQILGVSFATVNARLTEARAILRERLSRVRR